MSGMAIDGSAVKILRTKDGFGRTEFAEKVGISCQYLCDIEEGRRLLKRNPGLLKKIAETLNVPMSMIEHRSAS